MLYSRNKKNGNCLYRSFSYFLFGTQIYYQEIKKLIINWIENNYEQFTNFFLDDEKNNINNNIQKNKILGEEICKLISFIFFLISMFQFFQN